MPVSESDVRHVAALARLGIEDERIPTIAAELNGILGHMEILSRVDTSAIGAVTGIGADLRLIPAKPYKDPGNYVHVSRRMAEEEGWFWANQFDNLDNREGHRRHTGAEIIAQPRGRKRAGALAQLSLGRAANVAEDRRSLSA